MKKGKILIADDEAAIAAGLSAILSDEGYGVDVVSDGQKALERLGAESYGVVLADLKMPKMTGIELLAEAKKLRPEMPVVLMTAFATVSTAVEAMKLGAYDYIQKPFDGDEIKHLVDRTRAR